MSKNMIAAATVAVAALLAGGTSGIAAEKKDVVDTAVAAGSFKTLVVAVTEAGLADVAKLIDFVKAKRVKAIFVESSVPHNTIERISADAGVKVGGELFSDAMGTPGQLENGYDLGTYEGMVKHNLNTIVNALK